MQEYWVPDPSNEHLLHYIGALAPARRAEDHQGIAQKFKLEQKFSLSPAQALLFDVYFNGLFIRKVVGRGLRGYTLAQIESTDLRLDEVSTFDDKTLYGSREKLNRAKALINDAEQRSLLMAQNPSASYLDHLTELSGGRRQRDLIMEKWLDPIGRMTDQGMRVLSSKVGSPAGIKEVAHLLSSVYSETPKNTRDTALKEAIGKLYFKGKS